MDIENIVKFCAGECERQQSGEMSVYHMVCAYGRTMSINCSAAFGKNGPSVNSVEDVIMTIGKTLEPVKNSGGYRITSVRFANGTQAIPARNIPDAMQSLCHNGNLLTPEEFCKEFMDIHPFIDGNGRTGAIVYNWMYNTMENPIAMPNFYKPKYGQVKQVYEFVVRL